MNEKVYEEKMYAKDMKLKSLNGFKTKIVTYMRVSPADLALLLNNPEYYNDYRFDQNQYLNDDKNGNEENEANGPGAGDDGAS